MIIEKNNFLDRRLCISKGKNLETFPLQVLIPKSIILLIFTEVSFSSVKPNLFNYQRVAHQYPHKTH